MAIIAALAVIVCACSAARPEPVVKLEIVAPSIPAAARQACAAPVQLPDRQLSELEAATHWNRDRTALQVCETRRASAVSAVDDAASRATANNKRNKE